MLAICPPRHLLRLALISSVVCLDLVACGGGIGFSSTTASTQPAGFLQAASALHINAAGETAQMVTTGTVMSHGREGWSLGRSAGLISDAAAEESGLDTL
jgi:hypothetical protein